MQREILLVPFLGTSLVATLAGCSSGSKASHTTTPVAAEPAPPPEPAPEPPPAEPPPPPAVPPAPTYQYGKWVWYELRSTNVDKSKEFFVGLLGWQIEPEEMSGMKFELVKSGGKDIGTFAAAQGKHKSHWVPYASVPDVDAALKTIEEQKGKVVTPATDIPDIGRFAVAADPNGVEFAVFHGLRGDEPDAPPTAGLFIWNEYLTKNKKQHETALAFYPAALRYTTTQMQMGEGKKRSTYDMLSFNEVPRSGVEEAKPASLGGQFMPWVTVDDTDAVVANVKKLKGKVVVKPHDIPTVGRAAIVADPTGAAIGLLKPAMPAEQQSQPAAEQPPAGEGQGATQPEPAPGAGEGDAAKKK